ncbi:MAG: hypothetical protein K1X53_03120 [Candidatus Sumerlaeaceae bacterium]|nr:hypothetical protein [Candidatus Sumerlaeaceae bacterium]
MTRPQIDTWRLRPRIPGMVSADLDYDAAQALPRNATAQLGGIIAILDSASQYADSQTVDIPRATIPSPASSTGMAPAAPYSRFWRFHWGFAYLLALMRPAVSLTILRVAGGIKCWLLQRRAGKTFVPLFDRFCRAAGIKTTGQQLSTECIRTQPFLSHGPLLVLHGSARHLDQLLEIEGWDNLTASLENGSGVLLVSFHFGAQGLLTACLARNGHNPSVLRAESYKPLGGRIGSEIYLYGACPIFVGDYDSSAYGALRAIRRVWENGGIVTATVDGGSGKSCESVEVLGYPFQVRTSLPVLAKRMGAAIHLVQAVFSDGKYRAFISPELNLGDTPASQFAGELAVFMERMLRTYPDNLTPHLLGYLFKGV